MIPSSKSWFARFSIARFGCSLAGLALLAGCAAAPIREKSARQWFEEGQAQVARKRYDEAVEAFREAVKGYRDADLDAEIQIAMADAYFAKEEYPAAAEAYGGFLRLHVHSRRSDWAQYRIGLSWAKQMRGPDRSQEPARKAIAAFETLLRSYPRSAWLGPAQEEITVCRRLLAGHELYVGNFYFRTGRYAAAAGRFEVVVREYGDLGFAEEALYRLGRCYEQLHQAEKAAQLWEQLRRDFPQSRFVREIENQKG